jgi:hypothetical protein
MAMCFVKTGHRNGPLRLSALLLLATFLSLPLDTPLGGAAGAEQLDVTVELFTELLPFEKREKLDNFQMDLEDYFRDWDWIEDFRGASIVFTFRMYLTDESVGFENRYGARIHASNDFDLQFLDKDCHFAYQPDERLEHDAIIYHPLTGLLDYYAYLIIGGELDKRSTLGGDPYYKQAQEVVQEALFSEFYRGWNRRSEELERIMAEENLLYRKMLAVYFHALQLWQMERTEEARRYCRSALTMIEEILQNKEMDEEWARRQEEQIARFFTHHYREIAAMFAEDPRGQEVFELLLIIDPQNGDFYQDVSRNRNVPH